MAAHAQDVAERSRGGITFAQCTGAVEEIDDLFQDTVDAGWMARRALNLNNAANVAQNGIAVDAVVKKGGHVIPNVAKPAKRGKPHRCPMQ